MFAKSNYYYKTKKSYNKTYKLSFTGNPDITGINVHYQIYPPMFKDKSEQVLIQEQVQVTRQQKLFHGKPGTIIIMTEHILVKRQQKLCHGTPGSIISEGIYTSQNAM